MGRRQLRTGRKAPPLPVRDGLNPTRLRLPEDPPGSPGTVVEYLAQRFAGDVQVRRLAEQVTAGEVLTADGEPVGPETAYRAGMFVYLYRDPPVEEPIPFETEILFRDEHLVVVDKPHFLASTPRGSYVRQTALVRLRQQLDLPDLSPLHRLDRLTAGVLAFSVRPAERGAYQTLFARREVRKTYLAVAPHRPDLEFPLTVRNHLVKERGTPVGRELPGLPPNAETFIEILDTDGDLALYRINPRTGRTHQIRLHLAGLGIPIRHDPFYPVLTDPDRRDFRTPLQLLAARLEFDDPITGEPRDFRTRRNLREWPGDRGGDDDDAARIVDPDRNDGVRGAAEAEFVVLQVHHPRA